MRRQATLVAPSIGRIEPGRDCYLQPTQLRALAAQSSRYWSFSGVPTTVALPDNRFAKSMKGFPSHQHEHEILDLIEEFASFGVPRPSGYADVFHDKFRSPHIPWSINAAFADIFSGGWEASLCPGSHAGTYRRYDLRSAYLWSAQLGLPNAKSYRFGMHPYRTIRNGIYRVTLIRNTPLAPFPFNRACTCIATAEELETYSLPVGEIHSGVTWDGLDDPHRITDAVTCIPAWKFAARSYWGRWAQRGAVECVAGDKKWNLKNITLNVPWAHLIVSRVKMKLWEYSKRALHVFVDSIITGDVLPTGPSVGDWRLEEEYAHGVTVLGPGQYGPLDKPILSRMAGVRTGSPLRRNPAYVAGYTS